MSSPTRHSTGSSDPEFGETSWTLVANATEVDSDQARAALEELCRRYWYPVYAFVRRMGYTPHEAEDLTQELFCRLLQKGSFSKADRRKGKFRSFLIGALKNILADERDKARAMKRGGGRNPELLDVQTLEERYLREPNAELTPEQLFDRRWGTALLESALKQLEKEFLVRASIAQFELLRPYLTDDPGAGDYDRLALELGVKRNSVPVVIYRLRKRYHDLVRRTVAQTVGSVSDVESEMRALFGAS